MSLAAQIGVRGLRGADLLEDLLRRPAHAGVRLAGHAAVELEDAVQPPVEVHRPPAHGEGLGVAEVEAAVYPPCVRNIERLDHVRPLPIGVVRGVVAPLGEHLSLIHVPVALEVRAPPRRRQRLQPLEIAGVALHEHLIVVHLRRDEHVVRRVLTVPERAVDEQALDVGVARPAGVAGVVDARYEIRARRAQARRDERQPVGLEVCRLLEADHLVFLPLILGAVAVVVAVTHHEP